MTQWKKVKIGELFEQYRIEHLVQNSKNYGQITISKKGYVKFRTTKIGKLIGRKRQFIIDLKQHPNTLLFTRQGVADGAIGFAPKEVDACIATENMPMFELKNNVSKGFISFYLHSDYFKETIAKLKPTGSAQKSIHERDLMELELLIPSFDEQNVIANKIENQLHIVNDTSTEITHQQSLLKKLRQAILQEAIEGKLTKDWRNENSTVENASVLLEKIKAEKAKLVEQKKIKKQKPLPPIEKDEIPFDIPENWVWCRLGEIAKLITDGKHGDCQNLKNSGYFFLSAKDIQNEKLLYENARQIVPQEFHEVHRRTNLEPGDICMVNTGATVGKLAIAPNHPFTNKTTFQKSVAVIKVIKPFINNKFIRLLLKCETSKLLSTSWGSAINNLLLGDLRNQITPLPPLMEQKAIVKKVEHLFAMCDELETQINDSKANADMLMQAVLKEAFGN